MACPMSRPACSAPTPRPSATSTPSAPRDVWRWPNDHRCKARPPGRNDHARPPGPGPDPDHRRHHRDGAAHRRGPAAGWEVRRVLTWIVVAALLAIILGPLADITERRLHLRRALATLLVFLGSMLALAGILTMFIRPLASEGPQFIDRVPGYVEQARTGRGPVGRLVQRYNLDEYLQRNQTRLRESANRLTTPALGVLRSIFSTVVALVTIFVLTFVMVLQGPRLLAGWVAALPERRQERVRRVAADCAKAVTGYMTGNLVISVIAGT